jgi:hypothetical protein
MVRVIKGVLLVGLLLVFGVTEVKGAVLARGPYLLNQHESGITIRWRTDHSVRHSSVLRFGTSHREFSQAVAATERPPHFPGYQEWESVLTGLDSGTRYYYALEADQAILTGADSRHRFETSDAGQSLHRFWLLGDSGSNRPRTDPLETVLKLSGPTDTVKVRNGFRDYNQDRALDGLILLGDNAYPFGTDEQYQAAFFNVYQDELRQTPLWPCVGNHDMDSAYRYLFFTEKPVRDDGHLMGAKYYYSFEQGDSLFVVIDPWKSWWEFNTDPSHLPWQVQKRWIEHVLSVNEKHWAIVICHFPVYCDGNYDSDTNEPLAILRRELVPIFDRYGVDLVVSGHDHTYQRTFLISGHLGDRNEFDSRRHLLSPSDGVAEPIVKQSGPDSGTVYVVSGTGGGVRANGPLQHPALVPLPKAKEGQRGLTKPGSLLLEIGREEMECFQVGATGEVLDRFKIRKLN